MICKALVHMQDWPLYEPRDVDPEDEKVQGLLMGQWIVPVIRQRTEARPPAVVEAKPKAPEKK